MFLMIFVCVVCCFDSIIDEMFVEMVMDDEF